MPYGRERAKLAETSQSAKGMSVAEDRYTGSRSGVLNWKGTVQQKVAAEKGVR